jgi:ABC-type Mn2+/Zn2+ transport system ATPase subunit
LTTRGWQVGVIVGPSGSGKTSLGKMVLGDGALWTGGVGPDDAPIMEAIAPKGDFDAVTAALSAVGLGSVPSWLRPYGVLSNGEKFRAELARIVAEEPAAGGDRRVHVGGRPPDCQDRRARVPEGMASHPRQGRAAELPL